MRNGWKMLFLITTLILSQTPALAWGNTGHLVIDQISYSRLNPAAKARVERLAPLLNFTVESFKMAKSYDALTIGVYLDDVRNDPSMDYLSSWHFIDKPSPVGTNASVAEVNVVTRIQFCINALKNNRGTEKEEAELLAQLIHLVGDIHQPLHCINRFTPEFPNGDSGGNRFLIEGRKANLHAYWDAAGGLFGFSEITPPLSPARRKAIMDFADSFMAAYPETNAAWKEMDVNKWADESFAIAESAYTNIKQDTMPSAEYEARTQALSRERITMAGYRLAALLNDIYANDVAPSMKRMQRRKRTK